MRKVTIRECKMEGRVWTRRARTFDPVEAVSRVVRAIWGKNAWFWFATDTTGIPGLSVLTGYGLVYRNVRDEAVRPVTTWARVDVQ